MIIFLGTVAIIWLIQSNIYDFTKTELVKKLAYGRNLAETIINSSQDQLERMTKTDLFVDVWKKEDRETLDDLLKNAYLSNKFRRLMVIDKDGEAIAVYPAVEQSSDMDVATEDYFIKTKLDKKSHLIDLSTVPIDNNNIKTLGVTAPILDEEDQFSGLILGLLDLNVIKDAFEQTTSVNDGENFIVVNSEREKIIKTYSRFLTDVDGEEKIFDYQLSGQPAINQGSIYLVDRLSAVDWLVVITRPVEKTFQVGGVTVLIISLVILIANLVMIFFNWSRLNKEI